MRSLTPEGSTTTLKVDFEPDETMTGNEKFPVIGSILNANKMNEICKLCFGGLLTYADCIKKNLIGRNIIKNDTPTIAVCGAIRIVDKHSQNMYGFDYNPPYELHAWLIPTEFPKAVIDFSLPGLILRALKFTDELGPIVSGRKPSYIAGPPPEWIIYSPVEYYVLY